MSLSPPRTSPTEQETARLAALEHYAILDTAPEAEFDDIVRIAAEICGTPMALVSLVDDKRQWFKAAIGIDVTETPREIAFCAHAIQQQDVLLVEDATRDSRFAHNPLVTGDPGLRFYAGAPLQTPAGLAIGTLCVLDNRPRSLSASQSAALQALGRQVMRQLEFRQALARRLEEEARRAALLELSDRLPACASTADMAFLAAEIMGRILQVSGAGYGAVDDSGQTVFIESDWTAPGVASKAGRHVLDTFGSYIGELRRGSVVAITDAATDPRAHAAAFGALGLRAIVNFPLHEGGKLVALFFVNSTAPRVWAAAELLFVREVGERTRHASARRQAEADLRLLATSLEAQIDARLEQQRDLEERLRQSHKMEAIGQLTGGIAHDFNNLLSGILGSVALIRMRCRSGRFEAVEPLIDAAEKSAKSAASLTARLLAFSRRQALDVRPSEVNRLITDMEDLLRRTLGETVELRTVLPDGVWRAMTDANQLENALLNLAINARDAMPAGGRLVIETANTVIDAAGAARHAELSPGDYVSITVSDTGCGMTPDIIARAFDPFFTTKPMGQGTGLGLSMIYGFVKQSAGHASIVSGIGRGTSIQLLLPRGAHVDAVPIESAALLPRGKGETVLIVEDDDILRSLMIEGLTDLGYDFLEAADPKAALRYLDSEIPLEIMLTDVGLPYMNGRQLAEVARQRRPHLKVLFLTGYVENPALRDGALEAGMEMLTKPFTLDALALKVQQMLNG